MDTKRPRNSDTLKQKLVEALFNAYRHANRPGDIVEYASKKFSEKLLDNMPGAPLSCRMGLCADRSKGQGVPGIRTRASRLPIENLNPSPEL